MLDRSGGSEEKLGRECPIRQDLVDMTPVRGLHTSLTGPPSPDSCVDLLVAYFKADPSLDPGPTQPLAVRLGRLGSSVKDLSSHEHFDSPVEFYVGADQEIGSDRERARFFMGTQHGNVRYAYLIDDPDRCRLYAMATGGWRDSSESVTTMVWAQLVSKVRLAAPSQVTIVPPRPAAAIDRIRMPSAVAAGQTARALLAHATTPLVSVDSGTFVGVDIIVVAGAGGIFLAGADDDAVHAVGLHDIDGWTVAVSRSSKPSPLSSAPEPLAPGMFSSPDELPPLLPLSDIDRVPWDRLEHAYGPATDVPAQLRQFASGDDATSETALGQLYGNVFHQGTRYQTTPYVVPFLGTILNHRLDRREATLDLLVSLVTGFEDQHFPSTVPVSAYRAFLDAANDPNAPQDANGHVRVAVDINDAVTRLWPDLVACLLDPNPAVGSRAAHLLAYLPDRAEDSMAELSAQMSSPQAQPAVAASATLTCGVLGRHLNQPADLIEPPCDTDPPETAFAKSVARCLLGDTSVAPTLVDKLGTHHESIAHWYEASHDALAVAAIGTLTSWPTHQDAEQVLDKIQDRHPFAQAPILGIVMARIFATGLPQNANELSDFQRRILERGWDIATADGTTTSYGNLEAALPLPSKALRRYLDGTFELDI